MKLFSISITRDENLEQAIQKIHRDTQLRNWSAWEPPQSLMGNYRTLRLYSSFNSTVVCKVEGPGFIIDRLYEYFSKRT